jgi:hypothetical protein
MQLDPPEQRMAQRVAQGRSPESLFPVRSIMLGEFLLV